MRYAAILFDLDNTLYDYDAYWAQRLGWALEVVQGVYPECDIPALVQGAIARHVYARDLPLFLQQAGIDDVELCAVAQERYRVNFYERLTLYGDTVDVLRALGQQSRLGLITNGPAFSQRPKISHFGLEQFMDVVVVSEEVGMAKPDPAIFWLALRQLGVGPEEAVYVGDSLEHDLRGAAAAGLAFVWMNPRQRALPVGAPQPVATITRLGELLRLWPERVG